MKKRRNQELLDLKEKGIRYCMDNPDKDVNTIALRYDISWITCRRWLDGQGIKSKCD